MKMNKTNFDDYLNESLNQLNKNISPENELWDVIEHKITAHSHSNKNTKTYWPILTTIAASFTAVLVGILLFFKAPDTNTAFVMSEFFNKQKQSLLVQYQSQAALTDNWQVQLQELEDAELAIKKTLKNKPKNKVLLSMLAQVYKQQLDLINKVHTPYWRHI